MVTAFIILGLLIMYYIVIAIIKKNTSKSKLNRQNKDGSFDTNVSLEYVKTKINRINIEQLQCPKCSLQSHNLDWFEFRTSNDSWRTLAGSQGFYAKCPVCDIIVDNIVTRMS